MAHSRYANLQKNSGKDAPVALVTGGARRVGASIVDKLHQEGFRVIVHYRDSLDAAIALTKRLNTIRPESAWSLQALFQTEADAQRLIESAIHMAGQLDVLVNNASVFMRTPIQQPIPYATHQLMWTTNVFTPYWLSEAAFPFLEARSGVIINLTDIHAERPLKDYGVYCETKAALRMQTLAFAKAYAPKVRVNAVAPGAVAWPEGENILDEAVQAAVIEKTPLRRHGHPDWVAMAVFDLIQNPFITGQTLRVDGGRSLG